MDINEIMVVDDEPDIQTVAEMSLSVVGGWSVRLVSSGIEAIESAAENPPDLILLDVMMPGMDGLATLRALRSRDETREIPVILMTAKVQSHEVEGYLSKGADAVIPKPFDPMTLPDEIRNLTAAIKGRP